MAEKNCIGNCRVCGAPYEYGRIGRPQKYCSPECRAKAPRRPITAKCKVDGCDKLARSNTADECQSHYSVRWVAARDAAKRAATASSPCATCGGPLGCSLKRRYCSKECRDNGAVTRAVRRRVGRAYMAARRGVESVQFDPLDVLERDGWRCQLCGIATPRRLRGQSDARAPELDHIIPLSKGGPHTPWNTQCLCRRCNRSKSDSAVGQLGLPIPP